MCLKKFFERKKQMDEHKGIIYCDNEHDRIAEIERRRLDGKRYICCEINGKPCIKVLE